MMIALSKQHALIGITTEERDKIKEEPKLIHSLGVIIATVEAAEHGFENDIVLMLGEDCFVEEYHHHKGYDINNRANVVCMCSRCHSQEEN